MPTLDDMIARAKKWIVDISDELDAELVTMFRDVQRDLEDDYAWFVTRDIFSFFTVDGQDAYAIKPADWNFAYEDPFVTVGDGTSDPIEWKTSILELREEFKQGEEGAPKYVLDAEEGFRLFPIPDANALTGDFDSSGNYLISLPYRRRRPTLQTGSGADSSNWFSNNVSLLMIYMVVRDAMVFNREPQGKILEWEARANARLALDKRRDRSKRMRKDFRLSFHKDVYEHKAQRP